MKEDWFKQASTVTFLFVVFENEKAEFCFVLQRDED